MDVNSYAALKSLKYDSSISKDDLEKIVKSATSVDDCKKKIKAKIKDNAMYEKLVAALDKFK
jgi:hypothetical protein